MSSEERKRNMQSNKTQNSDSRPYQSKTIDHSLIKSCYELFRKCLMSDGDVIFPVGDDNLFCTVQVLLCGCLLLCCFN